MFSAMDISTSAMVAQRTRINVITSNIANISTTRNEAGEAQPYQPKFVVFQTDDSVGQALGAAGVKVTSVETANVERSGGTSRAIPTPSKRGPAAATWPTLTLT